MNLELYKRIEKSSAHTQNRIDNANFIMENSYLLTDLIRFSFEVENKLHLRGCCILEKVFEMQMELSFPYLDTICNDLKLLKNDSAIRSISRFVMFLVQENAKNTILNTTQMEQITEASFDWLIGDYRVAVKHHAVYTLIETGKKIDWVYPELKNILEKKIEFPSPGYRNIVRKFLKMIK